MIQTLFIIAQIIVPHHLLTRLIGYFGRSRINWIKTLFIKQFIRIYQVDLAEAEIQNPDQFASFNDFFVRALKSDARLIATEPEIITSPADGSVSQLGHISGDRIFQAKHHDFSLRELLGGDDALAHAFHGGSFATIYLAPRDYHRVHMPLDGELVSMTYVPGRLFSVNQTTTERIERLFARNERVICHFNTELGPCAVILVGAMIVGSIDTVWHGQVAPPLRQLRQYQYAQTSSVKLLKGDEMGRFKLGSTVIVLFPANTITWNSDLRPETPVKMGQQIGKLNHY